MTRTICTLALVLTLAAAATFALAGGDKTGSPSSVSSKTLLPSNLLETPLLLTFRLKGADVPPMTLNCAASRFGVDVNVDSPAKSITVNLTGELRPAPTPESGRVRAKAVYLTYDAKLAITGQDKGGDGHIHSTVLIEPGKTTQLVAIDQGELVVEVAEVK